LVERGHRIVTVKKVFTGKHARAIPFQEPAEKQAEGGVLRAFQLRLVAELSRMHANAGNR
jgi:hypothetical protein